MPKGVEQKALGFNPVEVRMGATISDAERR